MIGALYWALAIWLLIVASERPKTRAGKAVGMLTVALLFGFVPAKFLIESWLTQRTQQAILRQAKVLFEQGCLNSGERIHRTVDSVEGIFLFNLRMRGITLDQGHPDPYGAVAELGGWAYIYSFLEHYNQFQPDARSPYRYVEVIEDDLNRYRYLVIQTVELGLLPRGAKILNPFNGHEFPTPGHIDTEKILLKVPVERMSARYGVLLRDLTTPEERAVWIAGGGIQILDLETGELIAERVGYMMDEGAGSYAASREPWLRAAHTACPSPVETRKFVRETLIPAR